MPRSATFTFDDPMPYQAAIRGSDVEVSVTAKGDFRAKLVQIDFHTLWMQSGWENLPRVMRCAVSSERAVIAFLADGAQPPIQISGMDLSGDSIVALGPGSSNHLRSQNPGRWASMSLPPEMLSATSEVLLGQEVTALTGTKLVHPDAAHTRRLVRLHAAVRQLTDAVPHILAHPEVSSALEHELIHAMVTCLADEKPIRVRSGWRQHTEIINRFEQVLERNRDRPMHLGEICAAVSASEHTLRASCEEHLGMGPIRYLWLRRMHLARRALLRTDPTKATVTQIAMDYGFWELGRFSVAYQTLFGELPSASLRKPPGHHRAVQADPLSLAAADFA